jgi:hypothetical protein
MSGSYIELFGYSKKNPEDLLAMREVTLVVDSGQAADLARFFSRCAEHIEKNEQWEHEHFPAESCASIVVFNKKSRSP